MDFDIIIQVVGVIVTIISIIMGLIFSPKQSKIIEHSIKPTKSFKPHIISIVVSFTAIFGIVILGLGHYNLRVFELIGINSIIILEGLAMTVFVSVLSILLGTLVGVLMAIVLAIPKRKEWLTYIDSILMAVIYILLGIPALVLLFLSFYIFNLSPFMACVIGLAMNLAPFVAKIIEASLKNITQEQKDSEISFGYNLKQIIWNFRILFVWRNAGQSILVQWYTTLKLSSLAGLIPLYEFYHSTREITVSTYEPLNSYIIMALGYVILVSWIAVTADYLENRWSPEIE